MIIAMNYGANRCHSQPSKRPQVGAILCSALVFAAISAAALTSGDHPYTGIVERNVFALKPPTPVTNAPAVAASLPANIELRGITTILGRPQVLLNLKVPARPPEPPKDRSLVMDSGQREGDVEVLEINAAAGSVRLRNQGTELAMNLKDNAAKPQFSGVAPTAALPGVPPVPGVIPPPTAVPNNPVPNFNPPSAAPTVPAAPGLPTRNLRSTPTAGVGVTPTSYPANDASSLPLEAKMALIEVERERTKEAVAAGKMPPIPTLNMPSIPTK